MRPLATALLGLASLALAAGPALAQQSQGQRRPAQPAAPAQAQPEPPPPEPPPPPYERELLRLSEILGSLTFLRTLCRESDAAEWRRRMEGIMEAEGTSPGRRERLAGAFNKGYRAFALTYRVCTPNAHAAVARYVREGETLSRSLAGRYGG